MKNFKILNLEDNIYDSELIYEELKSFIKDDIEFLRVETKKDFLKKLFTFSPDLVLSDYRLPQYNGLEALEDLKETGLEIPFIIVTGSLTEETAADSIKAGAWDYVVKERLFRLETAVKSALLLKEETEKQKQSQIKLNTLSKAVEQAPVSIIITDKKGNIQYANPEFESLTGFKFSEIENKNPSILKSQEHDEGFYKDLWETILSGKVWRGTMKNRKKNQDIFWSNSIISPIKNENGDIIHFVGIEQDITEQKKSADALKESEQRYQILSDATFEAIFILDQNEKILNQNRTAEKMFGYALEESLGKPFKSWISRESHEIVEMNIISGYEKAYEVAAKRKDGSVLPCEIQSRIIYSEGKALKMLALRDITQRKIAEKALIKSEQKYRQLIENQGEGIIMANNNDVISFANQAAAKIFGVERNELINKSFREYTSKEDFEKLREQTNLRLKGEKSTYEVKIFNKLKEERYVLITATPRYDEQNKVIGSFCIFRDVTDRKQMLLELKEAKEKAEESDKLKTVFLQNMSHEIRTPMNGIMGFCELLTDKDISDSKRATYTDVIIKSSKQLLSIIQDIITISSLETGQERLNEETVCINEMLSELYSIFEPKAKANGLNFLLVKPLPDETATIVTDPVKLRQVFSNLISNAIKFTPDGSVTFGYTGVNGNLQFFVKDTGIGIHESAMENIFKRFWQVEQGTTRKYGGTGLGLSISKGYIHLLGGDIRIESEPNKGSIFYFTIPVKRNEYQTAFKSVVSSHQKVDLHGKTILVAEDEQVNYFFLYEMLKMSGARVIHASQGKEAVEMCGKNPVDLVLMDIKMPVMDGYEATKILRKKHPEIPVIAQTAYVNSVDKQKVAEAGFTSYIEKPIIHEKLMDIIRQHIYREIKP
ncbi:MAG: PAS domain S-box protein [Bacteroidales bacterium]|nr:PAS domain S-box protein [Bacteroidales bacterium]